MKQWYKNRKKDHFYQLAKKNDLISRAYYKLEEIDKKIENVNKIKQCDTGILLCIIITNNSTKVTYLSDVQF